MFNHTFHHIYKALCTLAQLSYRSNVQNIPYWSYIHFLWAPYTPQIYSTASSSMARNYFFACSIPIHLGLEGSALVSTIGPKQTLLDTRLWEHVASMNLVYESLFTSYLIDTAWCIKQTNISMVFISLLITSVVGLFYGFNKLSVNCG